MNWPNGYQDRVEAILGQRFADDTIELVLIAQSEAERKVQKARVRLMQSQLRAVRRDLQTEMRTIRLSYQAQAAAVQPALFMSFRKSRAGRDMSRRRAALRQQEKDLLLPYEKARDAIEDLIGQLESVRLELLGDSRVKTG